MIVGFIAMSMGNEYECASKQVHGEWCVGPLAVRLRVSCVRYIGSASSVGCCVASEEIRSAENCSGTGLHE